MLFNYNIYKYYFNMFFMQLSEHSGQNLYCLSKSWPNLLKFLPDIAKWMSFKVMQNFCIKSKMVADDVITNSKLVSLAFV